MPNYRTSTIENSTFQRNDHVGRGWRKRYVNENGGEFVSDGGAWAWTGSVSVAVAEVPEPVEEVEEEEVEEEEEDAVEEEEDE